MANTATVTGKCGIDSSATAKSFTGVTGFDFDCNNKSVTVRTSAQPSPVPIAIADGATISLTNTGGNYVLSIT